MYFFGNNCVIVESNNVCQITDVYYLYVHSFAVIYYTRFSETESELSAITDFILGVKISSQFLAQ